MQKTFLMMALSICTMSGAAHAGVFNFACADDPTNPKLILVGQSVSNFWGTHFQVSANVILNGAAPLAMKDPSIEIATSAGANFRDQNQLTEVDFLTGAVDHTGEFGFGQLREGLPANGKFQAIAAIVKTNGTALPNPPAIPLNCLGSTKHQGSEFWNSLGQSLGEAIGNAFGNR